MSAVLNGLESRVDDMNYRNMRVKSRQPVCGVDLKDYW